MTPKNHDLQDIIAHSRDLRAFADMRPSTLPDGQRIIEAYNAADLALTLLPDRGLDIWHARFRGQPLTWLSPGSPYPPDAGQTWTAQFNGGLLVTCGLTHTGPPETDPETGEQRGLHGRYSRLRAQDVAVQRSDSGDLSVRGTVWDSGLFRPQIALRRTIHLPFNAPVLTIHDEITNHGDVPTPFMLLYHVNPGYPLVREGAEMLTASEVVPRDADAEQGMDTWSVYAAPQPNYAEQVFFHRIITEDGRASAGIVNESFGFALHWNAAELPYLTQWKHTRTGRYVCGIEPGNCIPEGQNTARAHDRLAMLDPGETRTVDLTMTVLEDREAVAAYRAEINDRHAAGTPLAEVSLQPYPSG